MKLTDQIIKSAKPRDKRYNLPDGKGLALWVQPDGQKCWRFRYYFNGKEKMLSLGFYPAVSLAAARQEHIRFKELLSRGIDPSANRKEHKRLKVLEANNSFESIARDWLGRWKNNKSEQHIKSVMRRLENDIFPNLGSQAIKEITTAQIIEMVRKIESRGALNTARRALSTCNQVFRYSVVHGSAERNPAADVRPSDVIKPTIKTHYSRLSEKELPELLLRVDAYGGDLLTRYALQLMSLTFVRTSELIGAKWAEVDLAKKEWRISAERMKMKKLHIIPLSRQATAVFIKIKELNLDDNLVFPNKRNYGNHMSCNTILYALHRLGYHSRMTGHGFRGIASTILHERGYNHDHIELQLAHAPRNAVSAAYNFALYLEPRARMMQDWGDYLDEIKREI